MREEILKYLSSIKWDKDWSYRTIESAINNLTQSKCAIDIRYKKDVVMNEDGKESKEIRSVSSVKVKYISGFNENNLAMVEEIEIIL